MHISFNGVIAPYTYNCPLAHKFRNVDKIYPAREPDEEEDTGVISARQRGIEQHDLISQYIKGEIEEYDHTTDTIEQLKEQGATVEIQEFLSVDYEPILAKPQKDDYISLRIDAQYISEEDGTGLIVDWKFGNSNYGSARYYDETEFFLAMKSFKHPNIGHWTIKIHFPIEDYTLPIREYDFNAVTRLQQRYIRRIDRIRNDKFYTPRPSNQRCHFCDYRSEENGGTGSCEFSVR